MPLEIVFLECFTTYFLFPCLSVKIIQIAINVFVLSLERAVTMRTSIIKKRGSLK